MHGERERDRISKYTYLFWFIDLIFVWHNLDNEDQGGQEERITDDRVYDSFNLLPW